MIMDNKFKEIRDWKIWQIYENCKNEIEILELKRKTQFNDWFYTTQERISELKVQKKIQFGSIKRQNDGGKNTRHRTYSERY